MTAAEVVARFNSLVANTVSDEQKAAWVEELDDRVKAQVIDTHEDAEEAESLYITAPYDEAYIHWLSAKYYEAIDDVRRYSNEMIVFNELLGEFENAYNSAHASLDKGGFINNGLW